MTLNLETFCSPQRFLLQFTFRSYLVSEKTEWLPHLYSGSRVLLPVASINRQVCKSLAARLNWNPALVNELIKESTVGGLGCSPHVRTLWGIKKRWFYKLPNHRPHDGDTLWVHLFTSVHSARAAQTQALICSCDVQQTQTRVPSDDQILKYIIFT